VASSAGNVIITHVSASIQATARVEAPLGLTSAKGIDQLPDDSPELENQLFWLYHPSLEGVKVLVGKDESVTAPIVFQEYDLASLVALSVAHDAGAVTVTVVFTDN
jgi:hypothetical protein